MIFFNKIVSISDKIIGIKKDISNYKYITSIINKHKHTDKWNSYKLRVDWINRIYTVINLRKSDFGDSDEQIKQLRFMDYSQPVFDYLTELNLHQVVYPRHVLIKDTHSYLLTFKPLFKELTLQWIVTSLFKFGILVLVYFLITSIVDIDQLFKMLWSLIISTGVMK